MRAKRDEFEDGLDADGYPIASTESWRFVHGSEKEAGDFMPVQIGAATLTALERARHMFSIGGNCDSPIEYQLGTAVLMFFERAGRPLKLCIQIDPQNRPDELVLVPQFGWSYYRSDWAILNPQRMGALLIECDGKDFHTSPEQRAHDLKKDAAALDRGFLTMRFTGSAIFKGADTCAQKIYDAVHGT